MAISAETFQAIVKSVRADTRRAPRAGFIGSAVIVPRGDKNAAQPVSVLVRDLSPTEMNFVHDKSLKTGGQFLLCVRDGGQTRAIVCAVSRWHPLADGQFSITAALVREAVSAAKNNDCGDVDLAHVNSIEAKLRAMTET